MKLKAIVILIISTLSLLVLLNGCVKDTEEKSTLIGTFHKSKGYIGIVNDVLLLEFSENKEKNEEAVKLDGKKVEVVGVVKTYFPNGQCPHDYMGQIACDAKVISKVDSIRIIE